MGFKERLFNKRSSRHYSRFTLRKIVERAPDLFTTFFPIILTTPDVCSNLFPYKENQEKDFDIVLFDEASQLKLEENLPALLKGKQVIVAGDEHQMPPSNYFSKIFDGSIEDEDDIEEDQAIQNEGLLSCESLLDFADQLNFEKVFLDFHYRSKHPYLIDFSNHAFYNNRLMPLPNTFDYNPIKHIQVNGTYSEHSNEKEADTVISILNNLKKYPNGNYPSIGIATFNIAQRNLIIDKIRERQKFEQFKDFNQKIDELDKKGLFIKNLENIQGDERDVIILSTTYGVKNDGKFHQRFGPINQRKGYKLLNVIITRAKYKLFVCCSIPVKYFMDYSNELDIENNQRAYLYSYLAYTKAVSENNDELKQNVLAALDENNEEDNNYYQNNDLESPFEEEVYQALCNNFDQEKLIPQYKFAGFRIDIVYDSQIAGIPKIAIECDGAAYHESKEAYLHDLHRQKILESHGFVFHRIWSTNWWRETNNETQRLVNFIQDIEGRNPQEYTQEEVTGDVFKEDLNLEVANEQHSIDSVNEEEIKEKVETIERADDSLDEVNDDIAKVKINSNVKVKYNNTKKGLTIKITKDKSDITNNKDAIHKVNYKTALAASIIEKEVGAIVEVGSTGNYVEILEIEN